MQQYIRAPELNLETCNMLSDHHMDVTGAHNVQVMTDKKGILWVNVNGVCLLRICQIQHLEVNDQIIKQAVA